MGDFNETGSSTGGGFFTEAPCIDCGTLTRVSDPDELAVCKVCVEARRSAEDRVLAGDAGAQHMGRMRGTRDDTEIREIDVLREALGQKRRGFKGRKVRVLCGKKAHAIGKIKGMPKDGRVPVEIVDPVNSGWPVGYSACFLPKDLLPYESETPER